MDNSVEKEKERLVEEAALVRRASNGDVSAFEHLYETNLDPVYRYIYRRVESLSEAESLTSETFTRAVDSLAQGRYDWQGKPFRSWLIGIAAKILQERYRELKKTPVMEDVNNALMHNEPVSEEGDPLDSIVQQEELTALWQLVEELPVIERSVIVLRHVYELSYAGIAERLGRSEDACKQLHYRALKKLRLKALEVDLRDEITGGKEKTRR